LQKKLIITGVAGFIGSHVAEYFHKRNVDFACLVRDPEAVKFKQDIEYIKGDISDYTSLNNAFKNANFVIHIAGLAKDWGRYDDFYKTNVTGTENVMRAAVDCGIKNIIITGSISSYGEENSLTIKNENSLCNSHYPYFLDAIFPSAMNFYRDTKTELTKKAIEIAEKNNLNLTVVEPVWVYGEREFNTGFFEYLKTVKSGMPYLPGSKKNKFPVIHADDLARFFYIVYEKQPTGINKYIAGNSETVLMHKIYELFCTEINKKKPADIPKGLIYPIGFLLELFYTIFKIKNPPLLSRSRINMFYDNLEFSVEKAKKELGFTSEISLEQGIKKTVEWYKQNAYI